MCQDSFGDQDFCVSVLVTLLLFCKRFVDASVDVFVSVLVTLLCRHCAGFLILWPYTLGLTSSVHRGQPDDAIPIRDPSLTRHELFANYG